MGIPAHLMPIKEQAKGRAGHKARHIAFESHPGQADQEKGAAQLYTAAENGVPGGRALLSHAVEHAGENGLIAGQEHAQREGQDKIPRALLPEEKAPDSRSKNDQKGHGGHDEDRCGQHGFVDPVPDPVQAAQGRAAGQAGDQNQPHGADEGGGHEQHGDCHAAQHAESAHGMGHIST